MAEDEYGYRTEVLGEWVSGAGQLYSSEALAACTVTGRREIPPEATKGRVVCYVDPAAGSRGGDRFAAAWGFRDGDRVIVAALRAWSAPFSPRAVVREIADMCKRYKVRRVVGDRFGGNVVAELFSDAGLRYEASAHTSSDLYLDGVAVVHSGGVELPDPACSELAADLLSDLRSVIRRPGGGGRDRAEAPRGSGRKGHSDLGNAVVGLISALPKKKERPRGVMPLSVAVPARTILGDRMPAAPWLGGLDK